MIRTQIRNISCPIASTLPSIGECFWREPRLPRPDFVDASFGEEVPNADLAAALARFRASIPPNFNRDYVEHVVVPFFLMSFYEGERPGRCR